MTYGTLYPGHAFNWYLSELALYAVTFSLILLLHLTQVLRLEESKYERAGRNLGAIHPYYLYQSIDAEIIALKMKITSKYRGIMDLSFDNDDM